MMTKPEYLETMRDQISCEADAVALWDAYSGSQRLADACWGLFDRVATNLRLDRHTAATYTLYCRPGEEGIQKAMNATGLKRLVRVRRDLSGGG